MQKLINAETDAGRKQIQELEKKKLTLTAAYTEEAIQKQMEEKIKSIDFHETLFLTKQITAEKYGILVDVIKAKPGDPIWPGTYIGAIYDISVYYFSAGSNKDKLRYNMPVEVEVAKDEYMTGRVISNPAGLDNQESYLNYIIKLDGVLPDVTKVANRRFRVTGASQLIEGAVLVNNAAIKNEEGKRYVNLLEDGAIKKRYVKVGFWSVDKYQILYGAEPGQQLIEN